MDISAHRLVELLPDADGLVVRASDDELAVIAHCERPHLAVVPFQLLDVLELQRAEAGGVSLASRCGER